MHTFIALLEDLELLEKGEAEYLSKKLGDAIKPSDYTDAKRLVSQLRKDFKAQR